MASFNDHLNQALSNLQFLKNVNEQFSNEIRWKVTLSHYTALHLMHAYLADSKNHHPESHNSLRAAISPSSLLAPIDKVVYDNYELLENASRNARYEVDYAMSEKQLLKALKRLDSVIEFFKNKYPASVFPKNEILFSNDTYTKKKLKHFELSVKLIA